MTSYIESENLELKEKYTDTICKEIVAFLNAEGGQIIIGIKDNGSVVGVDDVDNTLKKIADVITTQIEPNPQEEISCELKFEDGKVLIVINVLKGVKNIYCQKKYGFSSAGCLMRIGTSCREMTSEQIKIRYEKNFIDTEYMVKKKSSIASLSFRELKIYYAEKGFHLNENTIEANLNLRTNEGDYNLLAELLSDYNNIPLIFVKFNGLDKTAISQRNDYGCGCLITSYEKINTRLIGENICLSDTSKRPREDKYLFDYDCANEALINALVHNDWTVTEPQISMFDDRIEFLSHGGLPKGMNKELFFEGISKPRNTSLMRIFLNLGLCEHTGHGIPTIISKYGKEAFDISDNYIRCTIPFDKDVIESNKSLIKKENSFNITGLNKTEKEVLSLLIENGQSTNAELASKINVTKRTIERAIASLQSKKMIERIGSKKDGQWIIIK